MKKFFKALMIVTSLAAPMMLCAAGGNPSKTPDTPIYVMTNDDGLLHSYVSFYLAGGTQGAPTLTYQKSVNTFGKGIGGGFFASPRVNLLPDSSAQCVYASDANTGDIAAINIQTQQRAGNHILDHEDGGMMTKIQVNLAN